MSGFGTKKALGDVGVSLTFPEVNAAARVVSESNPYGISGAPADLPRERFVAGDDLQSAYHEQKRADANHYAMAKVDATKRALHLWTHHGYGMTTPHPVLGQRVFANPSLGNNVDIYSNRHVIAGGNNGRIVGGILRTAQGQKFGHALRQERIKQLDAINNAKDAFISSAPVDDPNRVGNFVAPSVGSKELLAFEDQMDQVLSVLRSTKSVELLAKELDAKIIAALNSAKSSLFSFGVNLDRNGFQEVLNQVEEVYRLAEREEGDRIGEIQAKIQVELNKLDEPGQDIPYNARYNLEMKRYDEEQSGPLYLLFKSALEMYIYASQMYNTITQPQKERSIVSKSIIEQFYDKTYLSGRLKTLPFEYSQKPVRAPKKAEGAGRRGGRAAAKTDSSSDSSSDETVSGGTKWISDVIKHMKHGAFKKQAERAHESTAEYAADVLAHPSAHTKRTAKRAVLAKTLAKVRGGAKLVPKSFSDKAKFDVDQRIRFGDAAGAYLGESIGQRTAVQNVPIPVEPDGSYMHPTTGYVRPSFPKMPLDKKPSNSLKPRGEAPAPHFDKTAARLPIPKVVL